MLVEDTLRTCAQYLTAACREESKDHRAKTLHRLVLQGKLQRAVRCIREQDTGGVLQSAELCTKTRKRVLEVLRTKQPDEHSPTAASLDTYPDRPPNLVPGEITDNTMTKVAVKLSRGAGPGREDSVSLQH